METFSALLALGAGNSPVTGEFPAQRPVTRSFGVFFDLRPNKRLSKQWWGWWFETPSRPLWRHCNDTFWYEHYTLGLLLYMLLYIIYQLSVCVRILFTVFCNKYIYIYIYFEVELTFDMLTVCGQQHSFSKHTHIYILIYILYIYIFRLRLYNEIHHHRPQEPSMNLDKLLTRPQWSALVKFRMGTLPIAIKTGRYIGKPEQERLCKWCNCNVTESQHHFLFDVPTA